MCCTEQGCPAGSGPGVAGVQVSAVLQEELQQLSAATPCCPLQRAFSSAVGCICLRSSCQQSPGHLCALVVVCHLSFDAGVCQGVLLCSP